MKKGITSIVAVVLLIAIAVIAAVSVYFWMSGMTTKQPTPYTPNPIVAVPLQNGKVLIANLGQKPINSSTLKTSDPNLNISCEKKTIGPGEQVLCVVSGNTTSSVIAIYGSGAGSTTVNIATLGIGTPVEQGGNEIKWYYSDWEYRKEINVTNNGDTDLDYQIEIELNSSNFNFSHANSNGSDIRFTWVNKTTGNEESIPYWIEYWNVSEGKAYVWINVPFIPAHGNSTVYMYYGNYSASDEGNASSVFVRVIDGLNASFHLDEGQGTTAYDSSGSGYTISLSSSGYSWVPGKFGTAIKFSGGMGYPSDFHWGATNISVVLWMKMTKLPSENWGTIYEEGGCGNGLSIGVNRDDGKLYGGAYSDHYNWPGSWASVQIEANRWYLLALTLSSTNTDCSSEITPDAIRLYLNDTLVNTSDGCALHGHNQNAGLGGAYDDTRWPSGTVYGSDKLHFYGIIDEFLVFNKTLSQEEIQDIYNNYVYTTPNYPGKALITEYASPEPVLAIGVEEQKPD